MKRSYDLGFDPPAPVLTIVVHGPSGRRTRLDAKVDTAADVCGLPRAVVDDLELLPARRVRASTWRGEPTEVRLHRGDVTVAGRRFSEVEWMPIARPYALVGRALLNDLVLRLDGPRLEMEILRRASRAR